MTEEAQPTVVDKLWEDFALHSKAELRKEHVHHVHLHHGHPFEKALDKVHGIKASPLTHTHAQSERRGWAGGCREREGQRDRPVSIIKPRCT